MLHSFPPFCHTVNNNNNNNHHNIMSDWDTVTVLRKRAPKASAMKTETAVNQARRQGVAVDTSQKCEYTVHSATQYGLPLRLPVPNGRCLF